MCRIWALSQWLKYPYGFDDMQKGIFMSLLPPSTGVSAICVEGTYCRGGLSSRTLCPVMALILKGFKCILLSSS